MAWAKLDDRFHDNRKVKRAWRRYPASIGLYVMALTYSAAHDRDGVVEADLVAEFIPHAKARKAAVCALVEEGLWEARDSSLDGPWRIHDYFMFNPSREQNASMREAKREAGKLGASHRWGQTPENIEDSDGTSYPSASTADSTLPSGRNAPVPSRPVPSEKRTSAAPTATRAEPPDPVVLSLTQRLAAGVRSNDPKFDTAKATGRTWLKDMRLLLADRSGDAVEIARVIDFCVRDDFESKNVLSPGKLRHRFTSLLLKANAASGAAGQVNVVRGDFSRFSRPKPQPANGKAGAA